jgi:hypothetical protein
MLELKGEYYVEPNLRVPGNSDKQGKEAIVAAKQLSYRQPAVKYMDVFFNAS